MRVDATLYAPVDNIIATCCLQHYRQSTFLNDFNRNTNMHLVEESNAKLTLTALAPTLAAVLATDPMPFTAEFPA